MADRKIYETQFLLGAKVQSSLGKGFGAIQKNMAGVQRQAESATKTTFGLGKAFAGVLGAATAFIGFNTALDYVKKGVELAKNSAITQTKLVTIMKQHTHATDVQINATNKLAAQQALLGVVSKGTQLAGAQELAIFARKTSTIQTLIPAMNNLLAQQKGINSTSDDAVTTAKLLGKAMEGQTGALRRNGIVLTAAQERVMKYGSETKKAALLAAVITQKIGNLNQALGETGLGKEVRAKAMITAIQKGIGEKILPIQDKMIDLFVRIGPTIQAKILPLLDKIPLIIDKAVGAVEFLARNWKYIGPVVEAVTVAILANKVATLALVGAQKAGMIIASLSSAYNTAAAALALLREGNSLAAVAQLVLNGTMWACPVTWIIAGLMALVGVIYLVIKNWRTMMGWFSKKPKTNLPQPVNKQMAANANLWNSPGLGAKNPKSVPIPHHARGTSNFAGGLTWAGENGPELVNLPRGSEIFSNSRTKDLLLGMTGQGGSPSIVYSPVQNFYGPTDKAAVIEANKESSADFERRMNAYFERRKRLQFV